MSTYILVHGSFHGAWCWERIVPQLLVEKHEVIAIDLPGHGQDTTPIPNCTLNAYVNTVLRAIDQAKQHVVLVGHSFGGVIINQAAEYRPHKIKRMVYITAMIPQSGQSAIQLVDPASQVGPNLIINQAEGWAFVQEEAIQPIYYTQCSADDVAFAREHLVKEPLLPNLEPLYLTEENFGRVHKAFIECTKDNCLTIGFQRQLYGQTSGIKEVYSIESDHSPFLSHPTDLGKILLDLA